MREAHEGEEGRVVTLQVASWYVPQLMPAVCMKTKCGVMRC